MKIEKLVDLIEIRNYTYTAINNFSIDKEIIKELNKMLILIDRQITNTIISPDFKEQLGFVGEDGAKDATQAIKHAVETNNIRRGMKSAM